MKAIPKDYWFVIERGPREGDPYALIAVQRIWGDGRPGVILRAKPGKALSER